MADLTLERSFDADIETVFEFITKPEFLIRWWGPEGITLPDHTLDFTTTGPWHSVMKNSDGQTYTVSGHVTHVDAPNSVGFTWAWHDENGVRGDESHVTLSLKPGTNGGTEFTLIHRQLANKEDVSAHKEGWTSSLRKLQTVKP